MRNTRLMERAYRLLQEWQKMEGSSFRLCELRDTWLTSTVESSYHWTYSSISRIYHQIMLPMSKSSPWMRKHGKILFLWISLSWSWAVVVWNVLFLHSIIMTSRTGDVQPYLALGARLKGDGHRIRIATHETFRKFVTDAGLEFFNIGGNPQDLMSYMVKSKRVYCDSWR